MSTSIFLWVQGTSMSPLPAPLAAQKRKGSDGLSPVPSLYEVLTPEVSPEGSPEFCCESAGADPAPAKPPAAGPPEEAAAGPPDAAAAGSPDAAAGRSQKAPEEIVNEAELQDLSESHSAEFEQFVKDHLDAQSPQDQDGLLEDYLQALQKGTLKARSRLDQKWRRQHKPGSAGHERYKNLPAEEKRQMKMDWLKEDYEVYKKEKKFEKTLKKKDTIKGRMVTLGGLVLAYGGWEWPQAIRGAKRTAAKCAVLGEKWCCRDEFSEMLFFRLVEHEDAEIFEKAWSDRTTRSSSSGSGSAPAAGAEAEAPRRPVRRLRQKPSAESAASEPRAKKAPRAAGQEEAAPPPPKRSRKGPKAGQKGSEEKPPKRAREANGHGPAAAGLAKLLKEAQKYKFLYLKIVQGAEMLVHQIGIDAAMTWARGSELDEIKEQQTEIKKAETPVIQMMLQQDNKTLMENYEEQTLIDDITKFLAQKGDWDRLSEKVKGILEMHRLKLRRMNGRTK